MAGGGEAFHVYVQLTVVLMKNRVNNLKFLLIIKTFYFGVGDKI